jgi:hypothetical protein
MSAHARFIASSVRISIKTLMLTAAGAAAEIKEGLACDIAEMRRSLVIPLSRSAMTPLS